MTKQIVTLKITLDTANQIRTSLERDRDRLLQDAKGENDLRRKQAMKSEAARIDNLIRTEF